MKFSTAAVSLFLLGSNVCDAFSPASSVVGNVVVVSSSSSSSSSSSALYSTTESSSTPTKATAGGMSQKKEDRLGFMKNPQYHRRGFKEQRNKVEEEMLGTYKADLVEDFKKTTNYMIEKDGVKMYLAKDFGFCWGVERSIALAYEAVDHYSSDGDGGKKTLHITNELIHNPEVNDSLEAKNVNLILKNDKGEKDFSTINEGDVVILPAFGASYEEMEMFDKKNVEVVDTTCPWVSKVWNAIDTHQRKGLTSIIHGKYEHEETLATVSFCTDYICVKNMDEAQMVVDYILTDDENKNKDEFLEYFKNAISDGFDPDTMLEKVGLANQTTMYKKETKAIGQMFQKALMKRHGPADVDQHYMEFDTICDATQERQDAVSELVDNASEYGLDFILVVGGWDSSNTAHLLEIPHKAGVRSFHINRADCISADNTITHRTVEGEIITEKFLLTLDGNDDDAEEKDVIMGVTSGASTPDGSVQDALSQIFFLKQMANKN